MGEKYNGRTASEWYEKYMTEVVAATETKEVLLESLIELLDMLSEAQCGKRHPNPIAVFSRASEAISKATGK